MASKKNQKDPRQNQDAFVLLKRAAIAILVLVALAIALNLLQQALFPDNPESMLLLPSLAASISGLLH